MKILRWIFIIFMVFICVNIVFLWNQVNQIQPSTSTFVVCDCNEKEAGRDPTDHLTNPTTLATTSSSNHRLAVIVPFRDRFEEMMEFVPHIHAFLQRQQVDHKIWIINQVDQHRFNRAALLNIGFFLSRKQCDYMVMHDIDLLPLNDQLLYRYPAFSPLHISSPKLHPLYHYKKFVGGILMMYHTQFEEVNGLSNQFWGWGREDDELYTRMMEAGMKVHRPEGISTGYQTFKHIHDRRKRQRDQKIYHNQWEVSHRIDRKTGLSNLKYNIVSEVDMTISGAPFHFVGVEVHCDYKVTPFCDNPS